jgi:hypothetical protein
MRLNLLGDHKPPLLYPNYKAGLAAIMEHEKGAQKKQKRRVED